MKNYTVLWTKTAIEDLDSIIEYISIENPNNSLRILHKIKKKSALLYKNPSQGRIVPELGHYNIISYREIIVSPWRILYRIESKNVYVLAVIDGRRNLEDILLNRIIKSGQNNL